MARSQSETRKEKVRVRTEATAYHEAGHVVAKLALGLAVTDASIIPEDESKFKSADPPLTQIRNHLVESLDMRNGVFEYRPAPTAPAWDI